ncbi:MAG: ABC transporter permease [Candidatus Eisenbacteria bacterium]
MSPDAVPGGAPTVAGPPALTPPPGAVRATPLAVLGGAWFALAPILLAGLVGLPVVGLLTRVPPAALLARLGDGAVRDALALSLVTGLAATALVVALGLPVAWLLARGRMPGGRGVEALVLLPMVMPPTVAGFALLMAFGRAGLAGRALAVAGLSLPFTTAATVLAQAFMSAPFFILAARAGFAAVDPRLLDAAASLGAGELGLFARVALPLSHRALLAGAAMCAARALGEFGATITFAGNLRGVTQTMPLAVYVAMQSDLDTAALLSVLLLVMALLLLLGLGAAARSGVFGGLDADGRRR